MASLTFHSRPAGGPRYQEVEPATFRNELREEEKTLHRGQRVGRKKERRIEGATKITLVGQTVAGSSRKRVMRGCA